MSTYFPTKNKCTDNLGPPSDEKSRFERWDDTIKKIDASFTKSLETDASQLNIVQFRSKPRDSGQAAVDDYFSVQYAPGVQSNLSGAVLSPYIISRQSLREWIRVQKVNNSGEDVTSIKRYFERCVALIHSLVLKMIVTVVKNGNAEMEISVDPRFVMTDNLVVNRSIENGETIDFIRSDTFDQEQQDHLDGTRWKYEAMKALGIVAYELLMRCDGPPIMTFLPSSNTQSDDAAELMLNLDDSQDFDDSGQAKRPRASARNQGRLSSAMINVGVPYPLCRFVVDLFGGDCSNSLLFRSDNSFESFSDVLADLKQMMGNPEAFIHLSVKDQWRLAFGHKLHGRETEKGIIVDVASRITGATSNDALFEALAMVRPLNVSYLNNHLVFHRLTSFQIIWYHK
jgi:hypothetical protein